MTRLNRRLWVLGSLGVLSCKRSFRVGEFVLVDWEGAPYPAYIIEAKGNGRLRVHYDGYDTRWDQDVGPERVLGLAKQPLVRPPPPEKVRRLEGSTGPVGVASSSPPAPYRVGDHVRVKWRGSIYAAQIVTVISNDRFLVHYEGHENAWDEPIGLERIVARRP